MIKQITILAPVALIVTACQTTSGGNTGYVSCTNFYMVNQIAEQPQVADIRKLADTAVEKCEPMFAAYVSKLQRSAEAKRNWRLVPKALELFNQDAKDNVKTMLISKYGG